ncbi:MAG: hypothetical protein WBG86_01975 [Polyangiales bacterium]
MISVVSGFLGVVLGCGSTGDTAELPDIGSPRYGEVNEAQLRRMVETPPESDGPFYMVNLIKFREKADYADGRETDLTGREADAIYAPLEFLEAIGAEIAFVGEVEDNLITRDGVTWDQIGIVKYPSRAEFLALTQDPEFRSRAIHKDAGVERSIVMVADRQDPVMAPPPDVIPNPATPMDPAVAITHLLAYHAVAQYPPSADEPERDGREAMSLYEQAATGVALQQGGGSVARFDIEGVFIGDARAWDEFRINVFPSHRAFDVVVADPTRQAGEFHREAALEDTYSQASQIVINAFASGGSGALEVTDNGTGRLCVSDDSCDGQEASTCLTDGSGTGFCTVEGCGAGECEGDYLCCHDCADFAANLLPFDDSACVPGSLTAQLSGTPMCSCD